MAYRTYFQFVPGNEKGSSNSLWWWHFFFFFQSGSDWVTRVVWITLYIIYQGEIFDLKSIIVDIFIVLYQINFIGLQISHCVDAFNNCSKRVAVDTHSHHCIHFSPYFQFHIQFSPNSFVRVCVCVIAFNLLCLSLSIKGNK